jgi:integrase
VADVDRGEDGKRRRKWSSGYKTKTDAQRALREFLHKLDNGADPFPEEIRLRSYAETWLKNKRQERRGTTVDRYESLLRLHVLPFIGDRMMHRVTVGDVQNIFESMEAKGAAPASIRQVRAVLSNIFKFAMNENVALVVRNPAKAATPPKARDNDELEVPSASDLAKLMMVSKTGVWEIPLLISCTTGARRSEVLAIRWKDVDLDSGRLTIRRGLQKASGQARSTKFEKPKSQRSTRDIDLAPAVIARLKIHKQEQAARRLMLGPAWHQDFDLAMERQQAGQEFDLVCERGDGHPLYPDSFSEAFKRLANKAGLSPRLRLHDVRHGVATLMLAGDIHPGIASAMLGHASPAFTMRRYQHVLPGMTEKASNFVADALGL